MVSYSDRLREFLGMLPGAESLDDPNVLVPSVPVKRADYLLFQRSMIVEVKQLETDPAFKVEAVLERYKLHPSYPLFFGQRTLTAVLAHMPAELQEDIRQEVFESITRSIAKGCESANRQIRESRAFFGLAQASGILFLLNDDISILSPDVLAARVEQQMHRRAADGTDRFPEIALTCVCTWAHFVRGNDGTPSHPILVVEGPAAKSHALASNQLDYIFHAWSSYGNARLFSGGKASRAHLEDYRIAIPSEQPTQVPCHEAWRIEYRQNRYLGALTGEDLMVHGRSVLDELSPHFLVGGDSKGDMMEIMQRWTHFLEECELRNVDMRQFRPMG
jgi:hypothetical protein